MTQRVLLVEYDDGTSYTIDVERDDARGRAEIDRLAFEYLSRGDVVSCEAHPQERTGWNPKAMMRERTR